MKKNTSSLLCFNFDYYSNFVIWDLDQFYFMCNDSKVFQMFTFLNNEAS